MVIILSKFIHLVLSDSNAGQNITSIILCYSIEVKVNFIIKVKLVSVSNLIMLHILGRTCIVWSRNCKLPISNISLKENIKHSVSMINMANFTWEVQGQSNI